MNENQNAISSWSESSTRPAGFRQTLKVGDAEYGFCWIPAGEFDMGSPESEEGRHDDEVLRHVTLTRGFWLLETPTTQAFYEEVMGTNLSYFKGDDLPVEEVSWFDAIEFCAALTLRLPKGLVATLPTGAQWEYACRAGTKTPFWFGDALNGDKANCNGYHPYGTEVEGPCLDRTSPVKSYAPNPWGLYDVHGNVDELLLDCCGDYSTGSAVDPYNAPVADDCRRAIRGGSWYSDPKDCRSASRYGAAPDPLFRNDDIGFRVLLVVDDGTPKPEDAPLSSALASFYERLEKAAGKPPVDEALENERTAALWSESPTRPAGFRQTLTIGDAEYGFRWIPAGEFDMGSPESEKNQRDDEIFDRTLHHVKLTRGFWALETPTTTALYKAVLRTYPNFFDDGDDYPARLVPWDEAVRFCETLTKRLPKGLVATLPTEAQWEYACRAGTTTLYSFGDALREDQANCVLKRPDMALDLLQRYYDDLKPTLVKSYPPNPWGLYDMHGNVLEWVLDWYGDYPSEDATDPVGPGDGSCRVQRGGAFRSNARGCRSAYRAFSPPSSADRTFGFRFLLIYD